MSVPEYLRNVINPWQTEKDIRDQAKSAAKILRSVSPEKVNEWLGYHIQDKVWEKYPEK